MTSQSSGEAANESMFWIEILKKKKKLNTQDEFGIGVRFHIQLLSGLCHLVIVQDAGTATGNCCRE